MMLRSEVGVCVCILHQRTGHRPRRAARLRSEDSAPPSPGQSMRCAEAASPWRGPPGFACCLPFCARLSPQRRLWAQTNHSLCFFSLGLSRSGGWVWAVARKGDIWLGSWSSAKRVVACGWGCLRRVRGKAVLDLWCGGRARFSRSGLGKHDAGGVVPWLIIWLQNCEAWRAALLLSVAVALQQRLCTRGTGERRSSRTEPGGPGVVREPAQKCENGAHTHTCGAEGRAAAGNFCTRGDGESDAARSRASVGELVPEPTKERERGTHTAGPKNEQ